MALSLFHTPKNALSCYCVFSSRLQQWPPILCSCSSRLTTVPTLWHWSIDSRLWAELNQSESKYFTTDGRSISQYVIVSSPLWDLWPDITSCPKVVFFSPWGALSDDRTGLQFAVQSLNGSSRAEPATIVYCLIWDSPNRARLPYLYPPGTGWSRYTPGHWDSPISKSKSESKSRYDWRSVSQYVVVSSPLWDLWPDTTSCWCCDRRSVGLSVLVSGTLLGHIFCRTTALLFVFGRPLWREDGSVICNLLMVRVAEDS
jgi:hypothetical protein